VNPADASGLVFVDKPGGMTSHDVVARVRRIAGTRKVGHAGTLDPMATGLLVLGVNKATRLLGHLTLAEKGYEATIRLGISTTTDDAEGEMVATTSAAHLDETAVRKAVGAFVGDIDQVPSTVSAVKVAGRRAYALARSGQAVELAARPVTIHALDVTAVRSDGPQVDVDVSVRCSSGTYVRAVARDLGEALGVGGHLTALRRTTVGPVGVDEARLSLEQMAWRGELDVVSMADAARRFFPHTTVDEAAAHDIGFGRRLETELPVGGSPVALLGPRGDLLALYEQRGSLAVPVAVFV
jgi:tRNA pseudouridine55 synthase